MHMEEILGTYLDVVDAAAPGLVEGLYVVGSYALGDWQAGRSDVDIVAVTAEAASDDEAATLVTAHALLREHLPGCDIDGPYVTWTDLITPPMSVHRPWSLGGTVHHDGDCFELNPVTWYVLAEHGITVRGPTTDRLGVYVDVDARVRFVVDNLGSYWTAVADDVRAACRATPDRAFRIDSLEWCALGALRLHYTAFHGGVISKSAAGEYGLELLGTDHAVAACLRAALDVRAGRSGAESATAAEMLVAADIISWCAAEVGRAAAPGV